MPSPPKAEPSGLSLAIAGTLLARDLFLPKAEPVSKADSEPPALESLSSSLNTAEIMTIVQSGS